MNHKEKQMQYIAEYAKKMIDDGCGPFGALIVRNGGIIAEAVNMVTKNNDPTAHAEILAIRSAAEKLKSFRLEDCEIYSTCEPCPMCLGAIYWAGIKKVYFGATRKDAAAAGFSDDFIYSELGKSLNERALSSEIVNRKAALAVFSHWCSNEKRIEY